MQLRCEAAMEAIYGRDIVLGHRVNNELIYGVQTFNVTQMALHTQNVIMRTFLHYLAL